MSARSGIGLESFVLGTGAEKSDSKTPSSAGTSGIECRGLNGGLPRRRWLALRETELWPPPPAVVFASAATAIYRRSGSLSAHDRPTSGDQNERSCEFDCRVLHRKVEQFAPHESVLP